MKILKKILIENEFEKDLLLLNDWKIILSYSRIPSEKFSKWLMNNKYNYIFSSWWFHNEYWEYYFFYKEENYIYNDVLSWIINYIKNDLI